MKLIVYGAWHYDVTYLEYMHPELKENKDVFYTKKVLTNENVNQATGYDTVYLYSNSKITHEILSELKKLGINRIFIRSELCTKFINLESANENLIEIEVY